jgi:hypothetical protein
MNISVKFAMMPLPAQFGYGEVVNRLWPLDLCLMTESNTGMRLCKVPFALQNTKEGIRQYLLPPPY